MNKKGFTLIELLGTIVIIGLVIAGITFGLIKIIGKSKDTGKDISRSSIEAAASDYAKEKDNDEDYWIKMDRPDIEGEYFCVTIGTLQNKGLLSKDINFEELSTEDNVLSKSTYVGIKKDKITRVNSKPTLLTDATSCILADKTKCPYEQLLYGVCTNNILNEDLNKPTVTIGTEYTDRINNITFKDVTEKNNLPITINGRYYQYSDNEETINNEEKINIGIDLFHGWAKDFSETTYVDDPQDPNAPDDETMYFNSMADAAAVSSIKLNERYWSNYYGGKK